MNSYIKNIFNMGQASLLDIVAAKCSKLSFSRKRRLATVLAWLVYRCLRLRKKEIIASLIKHLSISIDEAEKLGYLVNRHFILNALEMASLKYLSTKEVISKIRVEGLENLKKAISLKKGAIVISGHFGIWEFIPVWLAQNGYPTTIVVRRQSNQHVDHWMEEMRHIHGPKTTDSGFGIREILRTIRRGDILCLMVDQDNGKQGIFVPFFKKWASTPTGPAQISIKTGAPIVSIYVFPDFENGHLFKISEPIFPKDFTSDIEGQQKLTAQYTKELERVIELQPHNWFWLHRRWKTQPHHAPNNPWTKLIKSSLTSVD